MSQVYKHKKIIILDFGSQYTQLICRKIRELNIYAEILPYNTTATIILNEPNIVGIIFSGGPCSIHDKNAPQVDPKVFNINIPILGICYGLQIIANHYKGTIIKSSHREFGNATLTCKKKHTLLNNITSKPQVWMSHADKVNHLSKDFIILASTTTSPYTAIAHKTKPILGLQFHPEVHHSEEGQQILDNFCHTICKAPYSWKFPNFIAKKVEEIKETVKGEKVLLGLSGGVDSLVTAKLIYKAIGNQLSCVYVDTGLMRLNETKQVEDSFTNHFKIPLHTVYAEKYFLKALKDVEDPEEKRKIIGSLFLKVFKKKAKELGKHKFLAQGTLYTDIIESNSSQGPSHKIKSHHNRVNELLALIEAGTVIEPLSQLFKDEVRKIALKLKLPKTMLYRHPFPGPGLAIRIIGTINVKIIKMLQLADHILITELQKSKLYDKTWQAFAVFLPVQSVGVMGDKRTYENVICLRIVNSVDGMTAKFSHLSFSFLEHVSTRIINEVHGINRVVYDISSKPPSTIEWE